MNRIFLNFVTTCKTSFRGPIHLSNSKKSTNKLRKCSNKNGTQGLFSGGSSLFPAFMESKNYRKTPKSRNKQKIKKKSSTANFVIKLS